MSKALTRSSHPSTSHAAAAKVTPHVAKLEGRVLKTLGLGGLTVPEIADVSGIDKWSVSPRMKPLEGKGLVSRSTQRRTGAIVWEKI